MRRSLRLDWRALALLGALLSIIIQWSGLVAYAMPAIFLPAAATTAATSPTTTTTTTPTPPILENISTRRSPVMSATTTLPRPLADAQDDRLMYALSKQHPMTSPDATYVNDDENKAKNGNDDNQHDDRTHADDGDQSQSESQSQPKVDDNLRLPSLTAASAYGNDKNGVVDDKSTQAPSNAGESDHMLPLLVQSGTDRVHNSQRLKMLNLISNKRKRKKIINDNGEEINDNDQNDQDDRDDHDDRVNDHSEAAVQEDAENDADVQSNISAKSVNANSRTLLSNHSHNINHTPNITTTKTNHTMTYHEKTLPPQLTNDDLIDNDDNDTDNVDDDNDDDDDDGLLAFTFTSAHHIAILSRTERSIRSDTERNPYRNGNKNTRYNSGAGGNIVRRSSDGNGNGGGGGGGGSGTGGVGKSRRLNRNINNSSKQFNNNNSNLDRNERSTISHLSGPSRKIQLFIKNRFIQLMPDGTVNGTQDDQSDYTILQRSTVDVGRIKIQGVATCLYLCMDQCGAAYGSKDFTDDCVFNENMEQHNYNTYSSTYNSNARRKYYLALNRHGEPRRLQIPPARSLGKLATYTNAITETVPQERVEQLIAKNFGQNRIKHGIRQLCDTGKPLIELIDSKHYKAHAPCNPSANAHTSPQTNTQTIAHNNSNSNSNSANNSNNNINVNNSQNKSNNYNNNNNNKTNKNSSSNNNNNNSSDGLLLNNANVPAANDKISNSSRNSSSISNRSSSSSSNADTNSLSITSNSSSSSSSSSSNSSSIDLSSSSSSSRDDGSEDNPRGSHSSLYSGSQISNSQSNNGHISNNSNNSNTGLGTGIVGGKKKKRRRKCRVYENEEEHNCQRGPMALRKRGQKQRCRELLAAGSDVELPAFCTPKRGKKNGGGQQHKKSHQGGKRGHKASMEQGGAPNKRGKKKEANARQVQAQNGAGNGGSGGKKRVKQAAAQKRGNGNGNGGKLKKQSPNSITTTPRPSSATPTPKPRPSSGSSSSSYTTARTPFVIEATSIVQHTTMLYDSIDPSIVEHTSDRGDREQRNVHYNYTSSMEAAERRARVKARVDEDDNVDDDVVGESDDIDDDVSNEGAPDAKKSSDDDQQQQQQLESEPDEDEDTVDSYEDDAASAVLSSSSHVPIVAAGDTPTQLTGGADDYYYDQFDFLPLGRWEWLALLWITLWCIRIRI